MIDLQTVRNVAIARRNNDGPYFVQVDDPDIPVFEIDPRHVVRIIDELVEGCSWSAEIECVAGLVEYLREYDIFPVDDADNGYSVRCSEPIESRLRARLRLGPQ